MAHIHNVYDTDTHFKIDAITRTVKDTSLSKTIVVQHDHNSERFTFEVPRMIDGHDMATCNVVQVHYMNIDAKDKSLQSCGIYEVDDLAISPESDDVVICSWLISSNATKYVGVLSFVVRFVCSSDGAIDYAWNTGVHSDVYVTTGIYNIDIVDEEYVDILEQWRNELETTAATAANAVLEEAKETGVFDGPGIESVEQTTIADGDEGRNIITFTLENGKTSEVYVKNGSKGDKGVGIIYIDQTETSLEDDGYNTFVATLTDGSKHTLTVKNGSKGSQGIQGETGPQGEQGVQGIQGEKGEKGDTGDSGLISPVSGFFTMSVDKYGNLWAYSSENESVPVFEYDSETGDLYFVTEQG